MPRKRSRRSSRGASRHNTRTEAVIKERNHVDESVCHLQDSSFQVSLGREGAVPVWVGMGRLATKSGEVPQSKY
jgi:spore maturation protein SpmA